MWWPLPPTKFYPDMEMAQLILVYAILALAVGYLVWKFVIPKGFLGKKRSSKSCGEDGCGCG